MTATGLYRTYDSQWNRTGYSVIQQYPGQRQTIFDFPIKCPDCGGGWKVISFLEWAYCRGWAEHAPEIKSPDGYLAYCANGHIHPTQSAVLILPAPPIE